eukprot:1136286-Pelagomonas_calceolata.AAC.2
MSNATVALRVKLLFSVPSSLLSARKMEEGNQQESKMRMVQGWLAESWFDFQRAQCGRHRIIATRRQLVLIFERTSCEHISAQPWSAHTCNTDGCPPRIAMTSAPFWVRSLHRNA